MQEFGSALDRDWLEFGIDPCVCRLSRYCLLFILTALPTEKIRLYKIKNIAYDFKTRVVCLLCLLGFF